MIILAFAKFSKVVLINMRQQKFDNSSVSMTDNIIASILQEFDQKAFFWAVVLVQIQRCKSGTRYDHEIL